MVFSSIPVYLDPPNWQQQPNQQQPNGSHLLPPLPQQVHTPLGSGSVRPGGAKMPNPETALKCPRCESTNTKFCYFNNYSLSQPRHFCKTCRRYWTRGGALRNVPVGGGCRRNKKSKRTRSKSPDSSSDKLPSLSNSTTAIASGQLTPQLIGRFAQQQTNRTTSLLPSLHNPRDSQAHVGFQLGGYNGSTVGAGVVDQWRFHQQFPNFLNGFECVSSFPFQSESSVETTASGMVGEMAATSRVTQVPPVKLEYNGGLNNHYYSWTDLSSSATHLM